MAIADSKVFRQEFVAFLTDLVRPVLAAAEGKPSELDTSLQRGAAPVEQSAPNDAVPLTGNDPLGAAAVQADA